MFDKSLKRRTTAIGHLLGDDFDPGLERHDRAKPAVIYPCGICKSCAHWTGREGSGANTTKFQSKCLLHSRRMEQNSVGPKWIDKRHDESCEEWSRPVGLKITWRNGR